MDASLPGTTFAFEAANIFARTNGYILKRNVDIGSRVKAGDVLAELTAPELDHQIAQAQATLAQSAGDAAAEPGEQEARAGDQRPRRHAGQAGLGDRSSSATPIG